MLVFSDNEEFSISKPVNSGKEKRYGVELVTTYSPFKWWRLMGEMNYFAFEQEGIFNISDNAFSSRLNSTIKTGTWSFQKNIDYRGARQSGQTFTKSLTRVNLGISKDIWKDKATITLNVNNLFGVLNFERFITGENYTVEQTMDTGRRITGTFTYRFNRKKTEVERLPE